MGYLVICTVSDEQVYVRQFTNAADAMMAARELRRDYHTGRVTIELIGH